MRSGGWTDDGKIIGWRMGDYKWNCVIFGVSVQKNFGLVDFSVQKQVLPKYTSLEEEKSNLEC